MRRENRRIEGNRLSLRASSNAWRRLPGPLSASLVTLIVGSAVGGVGVAVGSVVGGGSRVDVPVDCCIGVAKAGGSDVGVGVVVRSCDGVNVPVTIITAVGVGDGTL